MYNLIKCPVCKKRKRVKHPKTGQIVKCSCGQDLMVSQDKEYFIDKNGAFRRMEKKVKKNKSLKKMIIKAKNQARNLKEKERCETMTDC